MESKHTTSIEMAINEGNTPTTNPSLSQMLYDTGKVGGTNLERNEKNSTPNLKGKAGGGASHEPSQKRELGRKCENK